jgi:hypothetical protein
MSGHAGQKRLIHWKVRKEEVKSTAVTRELMKREVENRRKRNAVAEYENKKCMDVKRSSKEKSKSLTMGFYEFIRPYTAIRTGRKLYAFPQPPTRIF